VKAFYFSDYFFETHVHSISCIVMEAFFDTPYHVESRWKISSFITIVLEILQV
jgi:hypothetical protein